MYRSPIKAIKWLIRFVLSNDRLNFNNLIRSCVNPNRLHIRPTFSWGDIGINHDPTLTLFDWKLKLKYTNGLFVVRQFDRWFWVVTIVIIQWVLENLFKISWNGYHAVLIFAFRVATEFDWTLAGDNVVSNRQYAI